MHCIFCFGYNDLFAAGFLFSLTGGIFLSCLRVIHFHH
ncbi:putative membrane protein, partial [Escherichia coli 2-005-03_S4_C1]